MVTGATGKVGVHRTVGTWRRLPPSVVITDAPATDEISTRRHGIFSTGMSEIVMVVEDVEGAARFYEEVVGLVPEKDANEEWAWFWAGTPGEAQRVALRKGPLLFEEHYPWPEGERWGQVHLAFEVPRDKLPDAVEHVQGEGVEVYGPVRLEWMGADSYYF